MDLLQPCNSIRLPKPRLVFCTVRTLAKKTEQTGDESRTEVLLGLNEAQFNANLPLLYFSFSDRHQYALTHKRIFVVVEAAATS